MDLHDIYMRMEENMKERSKADSRPASKLQENVQGYKLNELWTFYPSQILNGLIKSHNSCNHLQLAQQNTGGPN